MFGLLEARRLALEQQKIRERKKIKQEGRTRVFVNSPSTIHYLREKDNVLVYVPEDLLIHGAVDPSLHGQIVSFVKFKNGNNSDAEIRTKKGETCCIPSFCLRLEDKLFNQRIYEQQHKIGKPKIQETNDVIKNRTEQKISGAKTMDVVDHFKLLNKWWSYTPIEHVKAL